MKNATLQLKGLYGYSICFLHDVGIAVVNIQYDGTAVLPNSMPCSVLPECSITSTDLT